MGLGCSKRQSEDSGGDRGPTIVRLSPFRPRRCSSLRRSRSGAPADGAAADALASPPSLLAVAADAAAASLARQPAGALAALPADLSQLLLERLVATGALDDAAVARLSGLGLHFYRLPLAAYPEAVRPAWLAALTSASLEEADLSKTGVRARAWSSSARLGQLERALVGAPAAAAACCAPPPLHRSTACRPSSPLQVGDGALAAMGAPPRLARLRLDYCVEVTDGGLALLQGAVCACGTSAAGPAASACLLN